MKRIIAETPKGLQVEITGIAKETGMVDVTAGDEIFYDYNPWPYRTRYGTVQLDWLKNIRVEQDPFIGDPEANTPPPLDEEYDAHWEWFQMRESMIRGEG